MASNPFKTNEREMERILQRLERKYDKDNEPQRQFGREVADIKKLLNAHPPVIDRAQAADLYDAAKARYDAFAKARSKRLRETSVERNHGKYYLYCLIGFALCMIAFYMFLVHIFG